MQAGLLSPTLEPVLWSLGSKTPEPVCPRAGAPHTATRQQMSLSATTEEPVRQQRHSPTKNKLINTIIHS